MEFPDLGKNCAQPLCNILEFVPFQCPFCKHQYCKDHFQPFHHECHHVFEKISSGSSGKNNVKCTYQGCAKQDITEMLCVKCKGHFCLSHRYHDCFNLSEEEYRVAKTKWEAPRKEFKEALESVNEKVSQNLEKLRSNAKHKATANKVQLMRLKGKAVGNLAVPSTDRVYFTISLPSNLQKPSRAVFVSKTWTMGRVIDAVAVLCDVQNQNNVTRSPKLRLFHQSSGLQPAADLSTTLEHLLKSGEIENGQSLNLEFVPFDFDEKSTFSTDSAQHVHTGTEEKINSQEESLKNPSQ